MLKLSLICLFLLISVTTIFAQSKRDTSAVDSSRRLKTVTIKAYLSEQPVLSTPASVSVLDAAQLKIQPGNSMVSAMNTIPGIRMEERSPGSYRLSVRGSLLRSPFGVRDVKVYFDEIPLTDAGGNTYLNAIDVKSVQSIEVLKGPDGSLFGANTGGVVIINPANSRADSSNISAGFSTGSYGLVHENAAVQQNSAHDQFNLSQAYEAYQGYRQNSNMSRQYLQLDNKWNYAGKNQLKLLGLYSNLNYETPGGLTQAQYDANPQLARLATKTIPGAIDQHIGISTKVLLGGLVNESPISSRLRNVVSVYGMHVDFANPFITNYEQRSENTYGLRTYFEYSSIPKPAFNWKINLGLEWQQTNSGINNYGNRQGVKDTAQTLDKINTNQHFIFLRYASDIYKRLHIEAALSLNYYHYRFKNLYPLNQTAFTDRDFTPQLMPRVALSYQITDNFIWRASVSRGYSTPTTAEIRPTDNVINTALQAETGVNYETGFRLRNHDETILLDASVFSYRIQNSIVLRLHPDETQYYVNAGGTNQPGAEVAFMAWIIRENNTRFIRGLQFNTAYTLSAYTFRDYHDATTDYSGNRLTGVPRQVIVSSVQIKFPQYLYLFVQHNYTAGIPLNDANTAFAPHYNLVQSKVGWRHSFNRKTFLELYAGVDNMLNEKYSLGDDLNAVGNRYFNASAPRNYYAGMDVRF